MADNQILKANKSGVRGQIIHIYRSKYASLFKLAGCLWEKWQLR
ncbi:ceramide kinase-like protein [Corchorus olitorius]|uniref:Ceramide kinase-like protein n=1 Tax=Corchorus olitorius TaxID=93759 RepID=A0A1R3HTY3_9ROSI|nr:ceramide kinase-like protein [Corchorus olitorius]